MINIFLLSMMLGSHPSHRMLAETDAANSPLPITSPIAPAPVDPAEHLPPSVVIRDAQRAAADEYAGKAIAAYPENYRAH
ncbi:hypothetical protein [Aquitalea magnusonii]|uniref:hypothetical protein n=1 Tax=Aquitalea magnusonii TaxID=332411 RepID=UPI0011AE2E9D|nr:hypothetical protein [Aquitalea magnusonii]